MCSKWESTQACVGATTAEFSIVALGQCGPVWPDLMISLIGVGSLDFMTSHPSYLPKSQLPECKHFHLFYSLIASSCKHSIFFE